MWSLTALDILYNQKYQKAYILEVNTAPGLEGDSTLVSYVEGFKRYLWWAN